MASLLSRFGRFFSKPKKFLLVKPNYTYFPLGLSYVASTLERAGIEYDFIDCSKPNGTICEAIKKGDYFAVGTGGLVSDFPDLARLVSEIKAVHSNLPCIVGGLVTRGVSQEVLFRHAPVDFAVVGEAELTLPELLKAIQDGVSDFTAIQGIMYRSADSGIVTTQRRPRIDPAQGNIFPSFSFIESAMEKGKGVPVLTGRGCSGSCTFCMPMHRGFRPRDFDEILTEVEFLIKTCHASEVQFMSEVVFATEDDIIRFFNEYKKRINHPFSCMLRLDVDPRVIEPIKDAGCVSLSFGAESGSDRILHRMGKGITAQRSKDFVKEADRLGIRHILLAGYMINNELETEEDIEKTIAHQEELNIRSSLSYTIPYPGTVIYKNACKKGMIPDEYTWLTDVNKLNYNDFLTDFMFQVDPLRSTFLPNLTDMPNEQWTAVLIKAAARVYNRYTLQSKRLYKKDSSTFISGNCPICGLEAEYEINLLAPIVRNLKCLNAILPNTLERTCYNDCRFTAHVFTIPSIARHAAVVDAKIAQADSKIGIVGDPFIIKFLVGHNIFSFAYSKVAALSTRSEERIGQYAFSFQGLPGLANTKLIPMEELVAMKPDYILAAEMPPGSIGIREQLSRLGYDPAKVLLMTPETILEQAD